MTLAAHWAPHTQGVGDVHEARATGLMASGQRADRRPVPAHDRAKPGGRRVLGRFGDGRRNCRGATRVITSTPQVLDGGSAEQRMARGRPAVLALVGLLACAAQVVAVGRSPVPVGMVLPDAFSGILSPRRLGGGVPAAIVIVSSALLLSCWWYMLGEARGGRLPMRRATWIVVAWAAPILPGPPLWVPPWPS